MAAENFKVKKGLEVGTGSTITSGGINITGVITATQLVGDGSGLTNVVGSGSGIVVKDEGSAVGTAGTINFVGSGVVASLSAGQATVTIGGGDVVDDNSPQLGGNLDLNSKFITGSGGISVTGVATATSFESTVSTGTAPFVVASTTKVTNLNADLLDGKSTANGAAGNTVVIRNAAAGFSANDVNFQSIVGTALSVAGISTFKDDVEFHGASGITSALFDKSDNSLKFVDNARLKFGDHNDLHMYHSGTASVIREQGTGSLYITAQDLVLQNVTNGEKMGEFIAGGSAKLYHNGQQKFTTTGTGIEVPDLSVTGVGTIGRVDVNGLVFGTNATTFAAKFPDSAVANFGNNNELQISHASNVSRIQSDNDILYLKGLGINFYRGNSSELFAKFVDDEQVEFYYNGEKRLETTGVGASCVGIMSATKFVGDGSELTGISGSGGVAVQDEGSTLSTQASTLNFVGSGVVASGTGATKTITISGGSGVTVQDEGSALSTLGTTLNFVGSGVVASGTGATKTITISGGGATDKIEEGDSKVEVVDSGTGYVNVVTDSGVVAKFGKENNNRTYMIIGNNVATQNDYGTNAGNVIIASNTTTRTATLRVFTTGLGMADDTVTGIIDFASQQSGTGGQTVSKIESSLRGGVENKSDLIFSTSNGGSPAEAFRISHHGGAKVVGVMTATEFSGDLAATNLTGTIASGRFPTTLPAVSGANLTSLTAGNISGTLATGQIADNAVTFAKMQDVGTGVLIGRNDGGSGDMETLTAAEVRTLLNVADGATAGGITTAATNVQVTWSVTANGSSAYRFTGPGNDGSDDNPDLYLVRGQRYRFINNSGGSHPFQIRSSAGGSAYNTGVENNGANSGNIDFNVQHDAPTRLYYQCTSHGGMVGNIYITGGASWQTTDVNTSTTEEIFTLLNVGIGKNNPTEKLDVDGTVKATSFSGSGANLTGIPVLTGSTNNQVVTVTGANALTGESNLVYDGNLGVGDATPEYRLKVYYNNNLADTVGSISTTTRFTNQIGNTSNLSIYDKKHQQTGNQNWYGTEKRIEYNVDDNNSKRMWIGFYNYEDGVSDNTIRFGEGLDAEWMRIDNGDVGIGVTIPAQKLDVDGTIRFGTSNISSGTHSFTAAAGVAVEADTTAVGSCSAIEYTIFVSHSTNIQSQKVLIMDNGTTAYSQEFSVMSNPNLIATFSADVSGSNVRLLATPETGISGSTTIKFTKTIIE